MTSEAFHEDLLRDEEVTPPSDRRFGLVAAAVFTILGSMPLMTGGRPRFWALTAAVVFAISALVAPALLGPVHRLMQRFARLMHGIVSPVVLGLLFFLGITPFGVVMRLFGHDPLRRRFEPDADSYWIKRPSGGPAPQTMRNQF